MNQYRGHEKKTCVAVRNHFVASLAASCSASSTACILAPAVSLAVGSRQWAVSSWQLAVGSRQWAVSSWQLAGKRTGAAGSKRGHNDQRKIGQNPYKIPHFKVLPDERADAN